MNSNLSFLSFYNFYKCFSLLSNMFVYSLFFPLSSIYFFNVNEWRSCLISEMLLVKQKRMNKILTSNKSMHLNLYDYIYMYMPIYVLNVG